MKTLRAIRSTLLLAAALCLLGAAGISHAAQDMFLKLDGIKGESVDSRHKDEIDVLAWAWGIDGALPGGRRQGQSRCVQDLSLTKYVDASSPILVAKAAIGEMIPTAKLTVRKSGQPPLEYLILEMTSVYISSVSTGGSGGEDRLTENVALNFATLKVTYTPQKADGSADAAVVTTIPGGCR